MIKMPENETQYLNELVNAAELGAMKALAAVGFGKPFISERAAFKKYGKYTVKRWIIEGLVTPVQDGPNAKKRIDQVEIEAVAKVSNRAAYQTKQPINKQ
jgi:hypothetical protein